MAILAFKQKLAFFIGGAAEYIFPLSAGRPPLFGALIC